MNTLKEKETGKACNKFKAGRPSFLEFNQHKYWIVTETSDIEHESHFLKNKLPGILEININIEK